MIKERSISIERLSEEKIKKINSVNFNNNRPINNIVNANF